MRLPEFLKRLFQPEIIPLHLRPDASRQRLRVIVRLRDQTCIPVEITVRSDTPTAALLAVASVTVITHHPEIDFVKVEAVHLPSAAPCALLAKHLARATPPSTQSV